MVTLQNTPNKANIMVPYVEIFYKVKSDTYTAAVPQTYVYFISEYEMDISTFKSAAQGIFIALNVIIGIVVRVHYR